MLAYIRQGRNRSLQKLKGVLDAVLVGDAMFYGKNGCLEFSENPVATKAGAGGGNPMNWILEPTNHPISDDSLATIMTIDALTSSLPEYRPGNEEYIANKAAFHFMDQLVIYKNSGDPISRAWGNQTCDSLETWETLHPTLLSSHKNITSVWTQLHEYGGGNGGAMHAIPIGLYLSKNLPLLTAVSIEIGRCTHNHPVGFIGSFLVAYLTHCALENNDDDDDVTKWPKKFLAEGMPLVMNYLTQTNTNFDYYQPGIKYFVNQWTEFAAKLEKEKGGIPTDPVSFLTDFKFVPPGRRGWEGSSGHDVSMYVVYALIYCNGNYASFLDLAGNHRADSDTIAAIAFPLFAILHGTCQIPDNHLQHLEKRQELHASIERSVDVYYQLNFF